MKSKSIFVLYIWVGVFSIFHAINGRACDVPVFRYALERWQPDTYDCDMPATPTNLVNAFNELPINLIARTGPSTNITVYWPSRDTHSPFWTGEFTSNNVCLLIDSPARREIVRHLQSGAAAVWVLLESGDPAADNAAGKLLDTELANLTNQLKVPEVNPEDPRTAANAQLKIAFFMIRVSRSDPAERLFIKMLLADDAKLMSAKGPIVIPVFGRGRALVGFTGDDLTAEYIGGVARFLCGSCSCEIKAQNPGWDLLIATDWNTIIDNPVVTDPALPPLVSLSQMAAAAQPPPPPTKPAQVPAPRDTLSRNLLIVFAFILMIVIAGTAITRRKS